MRRLLSLALLALAVLVALPGCSVEARPTEPPPAPLRIGVIADVQYADKPTKGTRRYAASLGLLEEAVAALNAEPDLALVVQLGDLIDGRDGVEGSREDLEKVLAAFGELAAPLVHVIGNHCLEVPRAELLPRIGLERGWSSRVEAGWRFVVLDSMAWSVLGRPEDDPVRLSGHAWLAEHPRKEFPHAQRWNGGFGAEQLAWLEAELAAAEAAGERVVVLAHHPVFVEAAGRAHLAWDHAEALALLDASPAVALWMNGHDHNGGYAERGGVHHLTLQAMVDAPEGSNAWAVVELLPDRVVVRGQGQVPDRELPLARR